MKKKVLTTSINIQYKGCFFHSLLELKFILMIEDRCSWIREPLSIYYKPDNLEITNYITENTKKYTPDFLVRKYKDNTAYLIEIKPKSFLNSEQMKNRKLLADKYLKAINADWNYKIITEDEIKLDERKKEILQKTIKNNKYFKNKLNLIKKDKKYNNMPQKYFLNMPQRQSNEISIEDYKRYVKYGKLPGTN